MKPYSMLWLTLSLLMMGCSNSLQDNTPLEHTALSENTPTEQVDGKAIYLNNCATCHGAHGQGNAQMMNGRLIEFNNAAYQKTLSDESIHKTLNTGKGLMPSFQGRFSATETKALIQYIRSLPTS